MNRLSIKMRVTAWFTVVMFLVATVMFFLMVENRIRQITGEAEQSLVRNVTDFVGGMASRPTTKDALQRDFSPPPMPNSSRAAGQPDFSRTEGQSAPLPETDQPPEDRQKDSPSATGQIEHPPAMSRTDRPPNPDRQGVFQMNMYGKGTHYAVYDENGELLIGRIPFDFEDLQFEEGRVRTVVSDSEKYLVYDKKTLINDDQTVWVKGVTNLSASLNAVNVTKTSDFLLIAFLIVIAAAGGYLIVKRALLPVQKMSVTAQEISESSNLSQRIALKGGKDEIYQLAHVLDAMLDRIESSFESEKQFTADASHELRTPVSVILSECEYALECAKTTEEFSESAEVIKRQAEKMSKLISELLMISRMDKSMLTLNFEKINLSRLLGAICEEQAEIHDIPLKAEIAEDVFAMADEMLLARLFANLISNAFEYGADGEYVKVLLRQSNNTVNFSVEDKGIGIPSGETDKIWERFYQVNQSRNNENGNMGLGLSMVREIAHIHNGDVGVKSEPGKGSVFFFSMPTGV